ncbi:hypothetical protein ACFPIK_04135 [Algoriphagus aquatilis]|uniref:DUF4375 domain-containing protein n=1 Tax=Algoriphagus aquatilis TaxID=490186 RepID=A0ABW0BT67_9BACT
MNKILPLSTEYITPSRSIEILTLINQKKSKLIYIYNYEGTHFRFFESLLSLIAFFEQGIEPKISFLSEQELDKFLEGFGLGELSTELNIKLNYRYRDAGNYKRFGSVIFSNLNRLSIEKATKLIQEKLISEEFFVPKNWNLPKLHFHHYDSELDHDYHEFESWELTEEAATDQRDARVFLNKIKKGL